MKSALPYSPFIFSNREEHRNCRWTKLKILSVFIFAYMSHCIGHFEYTVQRYLAFLITIYVVIELRSYCNSIFASNKSYSKYNIVTSATSAISHAALTLPGQRNLFALLASDFPCEKHYGKVAQWPTRCTRSSL